MSAGIVQLALSGPVQDDIKWYAIILVVFIVGVIFAIRSN
jgi:hypothetical protein